jgi:hypothetical protein
VVALRRVAIHSVVVALRRVAIHSVVVALRLMNPATRLLLEAHLVYHLLTASILLAMASHLKAALAAVRLVAIRSVELAFS